MILSTSNLKKNIVVSISTQINPISIECVGNCTSDVKNSHFFIEDQVYAYSKILSKNWYHSVVINLENSSTWVLLTF